MSPVSHPPASPSPGLSTSPPTASPPCVTTRIIHVTPPHPHGFHRPRPPPPPPPTSFTPMDTSCAHTDTSTLPVDASGPTSLARPPLAPCLPHPPVLPRVRPPQRRIRPPLDYCFQPFRTRECGLWLYVC